MELVDEELVIDALELGKLLLVFLVPIQFPSPSGESVVEIINISRCSSVLSDGGSDELVKFSKSKSGLMTKPAGYLHE